MNKEIVYTNYCSRCKTTRRPLVKYSRTPNKQYHLCRDCNAKKAKKYYINGGDEKILFAKRKNYRKYPEKQKARGLLKMGILSGKVRKPKHCSICGTTTKRIEGHHKDYSKPLEVEWLCTACHADSHKNI